MQVVFDKYLNDGYILESNIQCKKEITIIENNLKESTLNIISKKGVLFPKLSQYEVHKDFILKFEFAFGMFINPKMDIFHYTLNEYVICDDIHKINEQNIGEIYEKEKKKIAG